MTTVEPFEQLAAMARDPLAAHMRFCTILSADTVTQMCTVDDGSGDALDQLPYYGGAPGVNDSALLATFDSVAAVITNGASVPIGPEFFSGQLAGEVTMPAQNTNYICVMDTRANGPTTWLRGSGFQRVPIAGWYLVNGSASFTAGGVTAAGIRSAAILDNGGVTLIGGSCHAENFSATVNFTGVIHLNLEQRIALHASFQQTGGAPKVAIANTTVTYLLVKRD